MYANIVNSVVIDTCQKEPVELYHPSIAEQFVSVPEYVKVGMAQDEDGEFVFVEIEKQTSELTSENNIKVLSPDELLIWLGAERRIEIRSLAKTDPVVEDFLDMLNRTAVIHSDHTELLSAFAYLSKLDSKTLHSVLDDFIDHINSDTVISNA